jgi:hypothetical protein
VQRLVAGHEQDGHVVAQLAVGGGREVEGADELVGVVGRVIVEPGRETFESPSFGAAAVSSWVLDQPIGEELHESCIIGPCGSLALVLICGMYGSTSSRPMATGNGSHPLQKSSGGF